MKRTGTGTSPDAAATSKPLLPRDEKKGKGKGKAGGGGGGRVLVEVFAGITSGLMNVVETVTLSALVFSGPLAPHLQFGITVGLVSCLAMALSVFLGGNYAWQIGGSPGATVTPEIIALCASVAKQAGPEAALSSCLAALAVCCFTVGVLLTLIGVLRLGRIVNFIPFPVSAGFLAGNGWLLFVAGFSMVAGKPPTEWTSALLATVWDQLLICAAVGGTLVLLSRARSTRARFPTLLPLVLAVSTAVVYVCIAYKGLKPSDARSKGWLLSTDTALHPFWTVYTTGFSMAKVQKALVWLPVPDLASFVIVLVCILLTGAGLEAEVRNSGSSGARKSGAGADARQTHVNHFDYDKELVANGIGNIVSGLGLGLPGNTKIGITLLNRSAGGRTRVSTLVSILVVVTFCTVAMPVMAFFPRPVLGAVLVFIGAGLLLDWFLGLATRLPCKDFAVVAVIVVVMATAGVVQGVGVGIALAVVGFLLQSTDMDPIRAVLTVGGGGGGGGGDDLQSIVSPTARSVHERAILLRHARHRSALLFRLQGPLFFGTVVKMIDAIHDHLDHANAKSAAWSRSQTPRKTGQDEEGPGEAKEKGRGEVVGTATDVAFPVSRVQFLILDFSGTLGLDVSALEKIAALVPLAANEGFRLVLCGLHPTDASLLRTVGVITERDARRLNVEMRRRAALEGEGAAARALGTDMSVGAAIRCVLCCCCNSKNGEGGAPSSSAAAAGGGGADGDGTEGVDPEEGGGASGDDVVRVELDESFALRFVEDELVRISHVALEQSISMHEEQLRRAIEDKGGGSGGGGGGEGENQLNRAWLDMTVELSYCVMPAHVQREHGFAHLQRRNSVVVADTKGPAAAVAPRSSVGSNRSLGVADYRYIQPFLPLQTFMKARTFEKGQRLFARDGDAAGGLLFLATGRVDVRGTEHRAGSFLGCHNFQDFALDGRPRPLAQDDDGDYMDDDGDGDRDTKAVALEPCYCLLLDADAAAKLTKEQPRTALALMSFVAEHARWCGWSRVWGG